MTTIHCYAWEGDTLEGLDVVQARSPEHVANLWTPGQDGSRLPPDSTANIYRMYSMMHRLRVFANSEYGAMVIARPGQPPDHVTSIFPGFFRFPFMAKNDLQIGLTRTKADAQGQGLAQRAVLETVAALNVPGRRFWYLTEAENIASCSVIEKSGFSLIGKGHRRARFGLRIAGYFTVDFTDGAW